MEKALIALGTVACCVAVHAATPPKAPDAMKVVMYCDQGSGYDLCYKNSDIEIYEVKDAS